MVRGWDGTGMTRSPCGLPPILARFAAACSRLVHRSYHDYPRRRCSQVSRDCKLDSHRAPKAVTAWPGKLGRSFSRKGIDPVRSDLSLWTLRGMGLALGAAIVIGLIALASAAGSVLVFFWLVEHARLKRYVLALRPRASTSGGTRRLERDRDAPGHRAAAGCHPGGHRSGDDDCQLAAAPKWHEPGVSPVGAAAYEARAAALPWVGEIGSTDRGPRARAPGSSMAR